MDDNRLVTPTLAIMGTGVGVGKTELLAALAYWLRRQGWEVAAWHPLTLPWTQPTAAGESSFIRQRLARATRTAPVTEITPLELEHPPGEPARIRRNLTGTVIGNLDEARDDLVTSWKGLAADADLILAEAQGNPGEDWHVELASLQNWWLDWTKAPALLVADIDRGGVFAALEGTLALLGPRANRIEGLVINGFRGDLSILQPGLEMWGEVGRKPFLGVIPHCNSRTSDTVRKERKMALHFLRHLDRRALRNLAQPLRREES